MILELGLSKNWITSQHKSSAEADDADGLVY